MGPQLEPKVLGLTRSEQRSKGKPELPTQDPGAKHACRELEVDSGSKLEVFPINEQMLVTADISASWKLPSEPGCAPTCRPVPEQVATLAKPTRCPGVELDGKNIIRHGSKGKAESRMLQLGFQTDHKPGLHVNELCENLCHEDCKSNTQVRPTSQELVLRHMGGAVQGPSNMDEATNKTTVAMLRHQNPSQPHWITIANQHLQPGLQHPGVPQQEVADMLRPQNSSDLWVAVKGRPSVVPGQVLSPLPFAAAIAFRHQCLVPFDFTS